MGFGYIYGNDYERKDDEFTRQKREDARTSLIIFPSILILQSMNNP
jgi:hypothetical protein